MSNNIITIEGSPKEIAEFCNSLDINKYSLSIKLNNKTIDDEDDKIRATLEKNDEALANKDLTCKFANRNDRELDLSKLDTSKAIDMFSMFSRNINLKSLDLSNFNTKKVTTMKGMFNYCEKLDSLDLSSFNTSKVTDMSEMFCECYSLYSLDLSSFDTSNTTDMTFMFYACGFKSLDISNFDFSAVTDVNYMFNQCSSLTDLKFGKNLKVNIDMHWCPLTHESALSVINGLAKVKEQEILWLNKKTYTTLSKEEIKKAEDIGWAITYFY